MGTKLKILLGVGTLSVAFTVFLVLMTFFGSSPENRWWIAAAGASSGWLFGGIAFGPARWALTAVPGAAAGIFTILYVLEHSLDSRAWLLVGATLALYVLHALSVRRGSHA